MYSYPRWISSTGYLREIDWQLAHHLATITLKFNQPPHNAMTEWTDPSKNGCSEAVEDYLEVIHNLISEKGYARVVDIAEVLQISQASVTNMIRRLDAAGLLNYEKYRGMVLTSSGEQVAQSISLRHKTLTEFFDLFGLDPDLVYQDIEGMEHHISLPTLNLLEALMIEIRQHPVILQQIKQKLKTN